MNNGGMKFNGEKNWRGKDARGSPGTRDVYQNTPRDPSRKKNNIKISNTPKQKKEFKIGLPHRQSCFYCGEVGHFKRSCPEIYCYYCSKRGHVKKCCSFYTAYLHNTSSSSLTSLSTKDTKKLNINLNSLKCEEARVPQTTVNYITKHEFEEFQSKMNKSLKDLNESLSNIK